MSFVLFVGGAASGGLAAGRLDGDDLDGSSKICLMVCVDLGFIIVALFAKHSLAVCKTIARVGLKVFKLNKKKRIPPKLNVISSEKLKTSP